MSPRTDENATAAALDGLEDAVKRGQSVGDETREALAASDRTLAASRRIIADTRGTLRRCGMVIRAVKRDFRIP
jgi:hypothetical protein